MYYLCAAVPCWLFASPSPGHRLLSRHSLKMRCGVQEALLAKTRHREAQERILQQQTSSGQPLLAHPLEQVEQVRASVRPSGKVASSYLACMLLSWKTTNKSHVLCFPVLLFFGK